MIRRSCFLATCALLAACGADEARDLGEVRLARDLAQPIKGGQFDFDHTYAVGMITQLGQFQGSCSGTLIAPNLVLTARHCVSQNLTSGGVQCDAAPFGSAYAGSAIFITPDIQMRQQSDWYQGQEVFVPNEGNDTCGFDVALVILAEMVPEAVTPPAIPRIDLEAQFGEPYQAVGYGAEGFSFGGGRKILADLVVQCTAGQCGLGNQIASTEFLGDTGVCQGDSGGPAFDAEDKVIGVVSRGGMGCTTPIYGDVASWRDLIVSVAKEAAARGGYEEPFWAATGSSEPPVEPPGSGGGAGGGGGGAGGGGGGGGSPQGTPCSGACPDGYLCVTTGEADEAFCSAACTADSECGDGLECVTDFGACFPESASNAADSGDSSGCAVAPAAKPALGAPAWWLLGLFVFAGARRSGRARPTRS